MGAIENLKNVFDWKSSENQSSHGITTPVNGVIDWSTFPSGYEHWTHTGSYDFEVLATHQKLPYNYTYTYFSTNTNAQYELFKTWVEGLGLKGYTTGVPMNSSYYLPFGNCKLFMNCTHSISNPSNNSFHCNQFLSYNDVAMFEIITQNYSFTQNEFQSAKSGFLSTSNTIGFFIYSISDTRKEVKAYIYEMELTDAIIAALGTDYTNGFTYEDDPNFGSGGVAQGLQGIVDTLTSDVNVPLKSNKGVTGTGFVNIYEITTNSLVNFGKDMFSDIDINFNGMTSDEWLAIMEDSETKLSQIPEEKRPEASQWLADTFNASYGISDLFKLGKQVAKNFFNSMLIKYVLSVHVIPVSPTTSASAERINVGFKTFDQTAKRVTDDYIDFDCGTLTIPSKYKNFLDFNGSTKAKIYLPFIGMVDISPQYFYDCTIGLKYRFSVIDGTCVAFLTSTKMSGSTSLIGTYNGSCCMHIPFTGENYSSMISGVLQGVGGVASGVATANPMLALGGAMQGASSIAHGIGGTLLGSPQTSSSASFMGVRTPYIIIERPIPQLPPTYFEDGGAVAMITEKIGNCEGFTKCKNVHCSISTHKSINDKITQILETGFHA